MKKIIFSLVIASLISCQSEQKNSEIEAEQQVYLAHDPEEKNEPEKENSAIENACSDEYEHATFTLGKGLVMANEERSNNGTLLVLYNDSLLQDKYLSWNYYEKESPEKQLCPKYFFKEPFIFHFVYLRETAKSYQVINGFDEIKYLPKGKEHILISWPDYILSSFGVRREISENLDKNPNQPIKKGPSENSELITFPKGYEMLCPMEIKEDWVKVQFDCFYNKESNNFEGQPCNAFIEKCKPAEIGWIKWRKENEVLIDILLTP